MSDWQETPDAVGAWRAVVDALDAIVQSAPTDGIVRHGDAGEADEVRRVITIRLAPHRRDTLPALWARARAAVMHLAEDAPDSDSDREPAGTAPGGSPQRRSAHGADVRPSRPSGR